MDEIDHKILELLKKNARMQWKDIGQKVHLSGQAVAFRVRQMEESGVIQRYTAVANERALGNIVAFITVIMKNAGHQVFQNFAQIKQEIVECHRISGDGCYMLKVAAKDQDALTQLLDQILLYGNYRVYVSLSAIETFRDTTN